MTHYLLTSKTFDEKFADNINEYPLYVDDSLLSCSSQDLLFVFCFWKFDLMCLMVGLFEFILHGVCWASWMFIFMSSAKFGEFSAIISSYILSVSFSLSLSPGVPTIHMLVLLVDGVHWYLRLCTLLQSFFFCFSALIISPVISSISLIFLLLAQICFWVLLVYFSFQLLLFSASEILFGFFSGFISLYWYFQFVHMAFSLLYSHLPLVFRVFLRPLF